MFYVGCRYKQGVVVGRMPYHHNTMAVWGCFGAYLCPKQQHMFGGSFLHGAAMNKDHFGAWLRVVTSWHDALTSHSYNNKSTKNLELRFALCWVITLTIFGSVSFATCGAKLKA